jgi:hypothetical protein
MATTRDRYRFGAGHMDSNAPEKGSHGPPPAAQLVIE